MGPGYRCSCRIGFAGDHCEINKNDCIPEGMACDVNGRLLSCDESDKDSDGRCPLCPNPCKAGGRCEDLVEGYRCHCLHGYRGANCEIKDYYTLQQWEGPECFEKPARCFRLRVDECNDTLLRDGGGEESRSEWWGRLIHREHNYTIDLCWTGGKQEDPNDPCKCENHF